MKSDIKLKNTAEMTVFETTEFLKKACPKNYFIEPVGNSLFKRRSFDDLLLYLNCSKQTLITALKLSGLRCYYCHDVNLIVFSKAMSSDTRTNSPFFNKRNEITALRVYTIGRFKGITSPIKLIQMWQKFQ